MQRIKIGDVIESTCETTLESLCGQGKASLKRWHLKAGIAIKVNSCSKSKGKSIPGGGNSTERSLKFFKQGS